MGDMPVNRRQRQHDATVEEIKSVARALMAREGSSSINVRAVAREMGMTASALYRYFPSREAILTALIREAYDAVGETVEQAVAAAPQDSTATAILAGVHAFRRWALDHPQEYGLIYGTPVPGYEAPEEETREPAMRTSFALLRELARGLQLGMITPPRDDLLTPQVRDLMCGMAAEKKQVIELPAAVWVVAMQFWVVLYGAINAEIFHQLPEPMHAGAEHFFDHTMRRALAVLGVHQSAVDAALSPPLPP
jgi:AcrR family transcriptional regulator